MNTKTEKAIESFRSGLNCAQAVLTAYSDDMRFDRSLALSIACGFGGGMGRLQETCGAVTGSYMVRVSKIAGSIPITRKGKKRLILWCRSSAGDSGRFIILPTVMICCNVI